MGERVCPHCNLDLGIERIKCPKCGGYFVTHEAMQEISERLETYSKANLQALIRIDHNHDEFNRVRSAVQAIERSIQSKVPESTAESIHAGIRWGYRSGEVVELLKEVSRELSLAIEKESKEQGAAPLSWIRLGNRCRSAAKLLADEALG